MNLTRDSEIRLIEGGCVGGRKILIAFTLLYQAEWVYRVAEDSRVSGRQQYMANASQWLILSTRAQVQG